MRTTPGELWAYTVAALMPSLSMSAAEKPPVEGDGEEVVAALLVAVLVLNTPTASRMRNKAATNATPARKALVTGLRITALLTNRRVT